jgi:hypothetical protein
MDYRRIGVVIKLKYRRNSQNIDNTYSVPEENVCILAQMKLSADYILI